MGSFCNALSNIRIKINLVIAPYRLRERHHTLQTFTSHLERTIEGGLWLWQPYLFTHLRAVRRLNATKSNSQSDKSLLCWLTIFYEYGALSHARFAREGAPL